MLKSRKPRKQRKALYQALLHKRQKLLSAHLSKELRKQLGKRSLALRKGDEVKIMRGSLAGSSGKVSRIDLKKLKVYVEGIKRKKVSGEEAAIAMHSSNLMILKAELADKKRQKIVERAQKKVK